MIWILRKNSHPLTCSLLRTTCILWWERPSSRWRKVLTFCLRRDLTQALTVTSWPATPSCRIWPMEGGALVEWHLRNDRWCRTSSSLRWSIMHHFGVPDEAKNSVVAQFPARGRFLVVGIFRSAAYMANNSMLLYCINLIVSRFKTMMNG